MHVKGASDFPGSHVTVLVWSWSPSGHPHIMLVALAGNLGGGSDLSHLSVHFNEGKYLLDK